LTACRSGIGTARVGKSLLKDQNK